MKSFVLWIVAGLVALPVHADDTPYTGQEKREIKALAPERVEGLLAGAGLGYAKAAELNGWPGPLHAVELADALALSEDQLAKIAAVRQSMLTKAKPLGEKLVDAEAVLDTLFAKGEPDPISVADASALIGAIEAALRAVHLTAHIATKPLLTRHQRMLYARHRGYEGDHSQHGAH
ncbi:MAG: Spy/CpxP family protein refolding chaperone [Geminicoccaceae bacterium]